MAEPGRPSELPELTPKIRALVLEGEQYLQIQQELGIPPSTWDTWVYEDYLGFRANLTNWKHERMVKKAERNLEEMLDMPVNTQKPVGTEMVIITDPQLVRIKQDTSKFIAERLDKSNFAGRTEQTGAQGQPLILAAEVINKNAIATAPSTTPNSQGHTPLQDSGLRPAVREDNPSSGRDSGQGGSEERPADQLRGPDVSASEGHSLGTPSQEADPGTGSEERDQAGADSQDPARGNEPGSSEGLGSN